MMHEDHFSSLPIGHNGYTNQRHDDFNHHHHYPRGRHLVGTSDEHDNHSNNDNVNEGDFEMVGRPPLHQNGKTNNEIFQDEDMTEHGNTNTFSNNNKQPQHQSEIGSARTPWYGTAIVLLSEVMGTGILSLPYAARTLGWVCALVSVPLFAMFASYAGWLLATVFQANSQLHSFAAASQYYVGPWFGNVTKIAMLLNWGATAIYYLIATADGIGDILGGGVECAYQRSLIAACLLILPCQCRDFYAISKYLSGPSTCAIVVMVFIIVGNLIVNGNHTTSGTMNGDYDENADLVLNGSATDDGYSNSYWNTSTVPDDNLQVFGGSTNFTSLSDNDDNSFGTTTTFGPHEDTTPLSFLEALSAFVFAYQGHAIFLELMSEMKDAHQFPKACSMAYALMCGMYAMVVIVAYGICGDDVEEFLPDILPEGVAKQTVGVLVCLHITVSYVIACQPLHMWLHETIFPQSFQQDTWEGTFHWLFLTVGYLAFGFVIGNLIPFFADVQALIGSLFGAPTVFGWPVIFVLGVYRQQVASWWQAWWKMKCPHTLICLVFLLVFTPVFCILGTSGAISSIVRDAEHGLRPFQCND